MKNVAFSDSHGNPGMLRDAVESCLRGTKPDICVHCGDGVRDLDAVEPILRDANPNIRIYGVRGNCDFSAFQYPITEVFEADGVRMMATHGYTFDVKTQYEALLCAAREQHAQVAFFGHTHRPLLEFVRGIYLINPGAICQRMAGHTAYAQVLVEPGGQIRADLMKWLS